MKKFLLFIGTTLMLASTASAQAVRTVEVTTPGTLASLLGDDKATVTDLTVKGKINSSDLSTLSTAASLARIDLLDAQIVDNSGNDTKQIASYAFYDTKPLQRIVLPRTLTTLGSNSFYKCQNLEEVVANEGLTTIRQKAFMSCYALSKFNFTSTIESIGKQAFYKTGLTQFVAPAALTSIGENAFWGCDKLESVSLNAKLTSIGNSAFGGCLAVKQYSVDPASETFNVADGIVYSKDGATLYLYPQADERESFTTPATVTTIANSAFDSAAKLKELRISEGVEAIPNSMCYGDTILDKIYLPSTVKTIAVGAFDACSRLTQFHIRAVTPPTVEHGAFGVMFANYKMNLYVPKGSLDAYKQAEEWNDSFLTYNEEDEVTGVTALGASKQVASTSYYNMQGIKAAQPFAGVNVVVTTYTDGSKQVSKRLVK